MCISSFGVSFALTGKSSNCLMSAKIYAYSSPSIGAGAGAGTASPRVRRKSIDSGDESGGTKAGSASSVASSSSGNARRKTIDSFEDGEFDMSGGSTKSPRSGTKSPRGRLSRQNSLDSSRGRKNSLAAESDDGAADILDHRSTSAKKKSASSKSSKSSKKRVIFKVPLIDPRPEKMYDYQDFSMTDNSMSEEEYRKYLQQNDGGGGGDSTPRRMKKRRGGRQGRWRKYIPFIGQYIPNLPTFPTMSVFICWSS